MLEIGIIHKRQAALVPGVLLVEAQRQAQQRLHRVVRQRHAAQHRLRRGGKRLFHALAGRFAGLAPRLDGIGQRGIRAVAQELELGERNGQTPARAVPAHAQRAGELPQRVGRLGDALSVGRADLLLGGHGRQHTVHLVGPVVGAGLERGEDFPAPDRFPRVGGGSAQLLDHVLRPLFRAGVALHFIIQLQHQLAQPPVVPPGADRVGQREEARIRRGARIALLHHLFERRALHGGGAVVLDDAEIRRETEQMPMPAQQRAAEAVDRADLGAAAQRALAAQMAVGRVGRDGLGKLVHDAALQLAGRGARKGDDKEAVDILGVLPVGEIAHQPLGQYLGLAAARAGRDEHGAAAAFDRRALRGGGGERAHGSSPPSSSSHTRSAESLGR